MASSPTLTPTTMNPPSGVNLTALPIRLINTCRKLPPVSPHHRFRRRKLHLKAVPDLARRPASQTLGLPEQVSQGHGLLVQLPLARFNAGHVEHIVDQVEQVQAATMNVLGVLPVFFAQRTKYLGSHHIAEPDDGVQGCPEFVAHACQELGLGGIRPLGLLLGPAEFLLGPLPFRDVLDDRT